MARDQVAHGGCFVRRRQSVETHDAGVRKPTQKYKFPKVLVLGDKHTVFPICKVKQLLIRRAPVSVAGRKDIVSEVGQRRVQNARCDADIQEKPHEASRTVTRS